MKKLSAQFPGFRKLFFLFGLPLVFAALSFAQNISPQKRSALIIGNGDYSFARLENPVRDARLIGETLRAIKFQVTERENLKLAEMKAAIRDFTAKLPKDGVALFYFGGHGMQINGHSFILPTDFDPAKLPKDFDPGKLPNDFDPAKNLAQIDGAAVSIDELISTISAGSSLDIVILDACRDGQGVFSITKTAEAGLAAVSAPAGTLIAYSTAPGKTASDGDGNNSLYAAYLAENLRMKPSRLEDVFKRTRLQMINFTGEEQIPWENSSLVSDFYFTPDELAPTISVIAKNAPPPKIVAKSIPKLPVGIKSLLNFSFVTPLLNESGTRSGTVSGATHFYKENIVGVVLEMVEVSGSQFQMGTSASEADFAFEDAKRYNDDLTKETITSEMPRHLVNVPGFFIGKTEITQAQWQSVMGGLPEIESKMRGANLPVVNVSWRAANEFCEKLSHMTGRTYRLPSESEWEFAARSGTTTPFAFGESINAALVNFIGSAPFAKAQRGQYRQSPVAVGGLNAANQFGLYDMHGNVWEWTQDVWHPDYDDAPNDGAAWETTTEEDDEPYRVIRGGSWDSIANSCRSAYRRKQPAAAGYTSNKVGFRVVAIQ